MPTNLIILIAALIVALVVFRALLSLLKTFISTAVALIVIVIILMVFGFTPQDLIQEIIKLPETLKHLLTETRSSTPTLSYDVHVFENFDAVGH